jgi:hypothetical protein
VALEDGAKYKDVQCGFKELDNHTNGVYNSE